MFIVTNMFVKICPFTIFNRINIGIQQFLKHHGLVQWFHVKIISVIYKRPNYCLRLSYIQNLHMWPRTK
jgi:branched-subunit amino acid transport protein AzlD